MIVILVEYAMIVMILLHVHHCNVGTDFLNKDTDIINPDNILFETCVK